MFSSVRSGTRDQDRTEIQKEREKREREEWGKEVRRGKRRRKKGRRRKREGDFSLSLSPDVAATRIRPVSAADVDTTRAPTTGRKEGWARWGELKRLG